MVKRLSLMVVSLVVVSGVAFGLGYWSHQAPTPSTLPVTTTTTAASQPATAIWPFAQTPLRFSDPVTAASSFAVNYLGFTSPVVGKFQQGDTRSGEVAVRSEAGGAITTVLVRQVTSDDSWWILGAATPNIQLSTPSLLASVSSPVTLRGFSTAFEATVNVEVRGDQSLTSLGTGIVMGGSMGELGPFSGSISFKTATTKYGTIILRTYSAKDGSVVEAAAIRVKYAK